MLEIQNDFLLLSVNLDEIEAMKFHNVVKLNYVHHV